ncbi:xanthine dehydrogenase molybdopterin binding subunit [Aestuariivita sp.]|jgi:xanthine dehydrogenase large subunit|uniref:xanthine dehydrogenase molybdopterin binding subunit n=1 Tax=Aestuariivita sp. TaxID=1872407 RepID=UPI002173E0BA|nr:xanthine dehydrogenase molybdopterin binding subunit [Aestuariivita sp.]MCE8008512.1 xanthine dehydrogenase molybdopterin binding subunit [Aestuariivita sp.]
MSIAKPLPHDAAALHVTGAARYVDDIPAPTGTLHLAFGLSDVARGRIEVMDLDAVRTAPDVVAVLTAGDLEFDADTSPSNHDEPLLATEEVYYAGQPLFLVIARSHLAARKAARLGCVTITETEPILTIEQALEADSRFEDGPRIYEKGATDAALAAAPNRLQGRIEIGGQEHFYLEGQAAMVWPQEGGDCHVFSSTQHPTEIQHKVAHAIGQPMHAVRVETRRMGGGFGGKESQGNALAIACAVAARLTGKPCKMRYDRDDDMIITGKRHDFRIDYDVGYDDAGRVLAVSFRHYTRCGWSMDLSLPVADRAMLHADNAYDIAHMRIESHRLRTNMCSATAFRGFGGPQGMLGIERVMDHVAHASGIDPVALRRRNYYPSARAVADGQSPGITPYNMKVTDFELHELTEQLLQRADYAARKQTIADWNAQNPVIKKGIGFSPVKFGISFTLTHLNQAGALVHVYQDGSVHLNHGGTEMGQGLFQKVAQVAAARFGLPLERIRITATDTGKVPNTSATAASSGSDLNGMAVKAACDTICDRIAAHLAERHQTAVDAVRFEGGQVHVGDHAISFAQAAQSAWMARVSLSAAGFYKTPSLEWDRIRGTGRPFFYFAYGAALTEVAVDTLTGENRILRTDILHDAGASLNPAIDLGQIEGGYVQGAGWLTTEELVWDDAGRLRTHAPSTYKIPACSDRPDVFNVALWDAQNREETIYRSKAVGEPPLMLGISALLALSDAVAACGNRYPSLDAPATAERIWATLETMT